MRRTNSPRIACFLQVFNEIKTGHLQRFISWNEPLYDVLCVYDDASNDGTTEFLQDKADLLLSGTINQFKTEQLNRSLLLEAARKAFPSIEWFLWLDADEVLYCSRAELDDLLMQLDAEGMDGASLPHINLWRSEHFFRRDEYFDQLEPVRLWRNSENISFELEGGLHREMHPHGLNAIRRLSQPAVVHYGFASDKYIIDKIATYASVGQNGWPLNRLMSERGLCIQSLSTRRNLLGQRWLPPTTGDGPAPIARTTSSWMFEVLHRLRIERRREHRPQVTIVTLIYKSCEWLEFIYGEMLRLRDSFGRGVVELLVVANDAEPEVVVFLKENLIPHIEVETKISGDEWFINSVYRAYNSGLLHAQGEYVLFINSDMAFSPNFLVNLWHNRDASKLLAGRLVEQGVMRSGEHGIEKSFGSTPRGFRRRAFEKYASELQRAEVRLGGLFMPLLVHRSTFINLGLFPEGNLTPDALEVYIKSGVVTSYAVSGESCVPGDQAFVARANSLGVQHFTDFGAIAYHFQAGEMRAVGRRSRYPGSGVAIINDLIDGINGERVLWRMCVDTLRRAGVRVEEIESKGRVRGLLFHCYVRLKLRTERSVRLCFANATYSYPLPKKYRRLVLRQDQPASKRLRLLQTLVRRKCDLVLANDADFASTETGEVREWMLVPLSNVWSQPPPPVRLNPIGIFVGAFNETKGWNQVKNLVESRHDVKWILVSKYPHDAHGLTADSGHNWEVYRCISSEKILDLMETASFFVLGSAYETQCLAAIEAASRNLPVLMPPTGLLGGLDTTVSTKIGVFTDDLSHGLAEILLGLRIKRFEPRAALDGLGLFEDDVLDDWEHMFRREIEATFFKSKDRSFTAAILSTKHRLESKWHYLYYRMIRPSIKVLHRRLTAKFS